MHTRDRRRLRQLSLEDLVRTLPQWREFPEATRVEAARLMAKLLLEFVGSEEDENADR